MLLLFQALFDPDKRHPFLAKYWFRKVDGFPNRAEMLSRYIDSYAREIATLLETGMIQRRIRGIGYLLCVGASLSFAVAFCASTISKSSEQNEAITAENIIVISLIIWGILFILGLILWDFILRVGNYRLYLIRLCYENFSIIHKLGFRDPGLDTDYKDEVVKLASANSPQFLRSFGFARELKRRFVPGFLTTVGQIDSKADLYWELGTAIDTGRRLDYALEHLFSSRVFGLEAASFSSELKLGEYRMQSMNLVRDSGQMALIALCGVKKPSVFISAVDKELITRVSEKSKNERRLRSGLIFAVPILLAGTTLGIAKFVYPDSNWLALVSYILTALPLLHRLYISLRQYFKGDAMGAQSVLQIADLDSEQAISDSRTH